MTAPKNLQVHIFADGADLADILEMAKDPLIKKCTTNPTLMRKVILKKRDVIGMGLINLLETVKMFRKDAVMAGHSIASALGRGAQ